MRKFALFLMFIGVLLIAAPFVLMNYDLLETKSKEKVIVEKDYNYISFNDLTENGKKTVLSKLYSKNGSSEDTKLSLNTQTYTIYEIFSPNEVYKLDINKNKNILTSDLSRLKNIDFYVINSMNYIVKLKFSFEKGTVPTYKEDKIIKKDNWVFFYDQKELTLYGYYQIDSGYFLVKLADGNLDNSNDIQDDLINIIVKNIMITKEDETTIDKYTNLYNNSVTSFIELSKEDSIYTLDKDNKIDLGTNYYITKWNVADNWLSNEIGLESKDFSNSLSIRESIKDYSLDTIKKALNGNNIEELDYNGNKVNIINEYNSDRLQGYIKKINNKSYTVIYNLNKSTILNVTSNDKNQFIEYIEKNVYNYGG